MDGLTVAALRRVWAEVYRQARIEKIHQPSEREITVSVRTPQGVHRLMLSAHRQFARAHRLVHARPENPPEAPMFCMLLRRRLEGGRIRDVRQPAWERALHIVIERVDELGDLREYVLVLEMMGKHSNLMLCEGDGEGAPVRVIDAIVHVTPDMSRVRPILPGSPFTPPPPQRRLAWDEVTADDLAQLDLPGVPAAKRRLALAQRVAGMGPVTAAEVMARAGSLAPEALREAIRELYAAVLNGAETPSLGLDELGRPLAAAPFTLTHLPRRELLVSLDEALDRLYSEQAEHMLESRRKRQLEQAVQAHIDRLRGKLAKLDEAERESEGHELLRIQGELLTTYAHQLEKGQTEAVLPNYYDEMRPIRIPLDPALTPIENAQRYFRLSSRRKRALPVLAEERAQAEADLAYLESVLVQLRDAGTADLELIARELAQQGFWTEPRSRKGSSTTGGRRRDAAQPDAYESSDGFIIRVGRNNVQNDRLTLRASQPHDVWLHVKDMPGSHVVISTEGKAVPDSTLEEAALLAAWFSKGRDSSRVAVDHTLIRNVWKARGARPGQVLYEGQRTLYVTPDRSRIEQILERRHRPRRADTPASAEPGQDEP
ncbi:MAG: NFACT family protein [Thermoflavifilum sp.]|nr:NFACT family protein [Thermoflavifilum sp.]MCL6513302.1 NFACT family protein [Alicyclobacillus sp.]